jgi:hypothetical protein
MPRYIVQVYYLDGKSKQIGEPLEDYALARTKAKNLAKAIKNLKGVIIFQNYGYNGSNKRTNRVIEAFNKDKSWHP